MNTMTPTTDLIRYGKYYERMGRKPKGYIPVIKKENIELAEQYINYISTIYEEYIEVFSNMYNDEDLAGEVLLKTYNCIKNNGLSTIDLETEEDLKKKVFKNYFFISAKLTNITNKKYQQKSPIRDTNENIDTIDDLPTEEKIKNQIYKDYRVMYIINTVEENFDAIDYRCFRLYHLLKNMTYAKLRQLTGIKNAKMRVITINKWLRQNITEQQILESFNREFNDFEY